MQFGKQEDNELLVLCAADELNKIQREAPRKAVELLRKHDDGPRRLYTGPEVDLGVSRWRKSVDDGALCGQVRGAGPGLPTADGRSSRQVRPRTRGGCERTACWGRTAPSRGRATNCQQAPPVHV